MLANYHGHYALPRRFNPAKSPKMQSVGVYLWQYGTAFECQINKKRTPTDSFLAILLTGNNLHLEIRGFF